MENENKLNASTEEENTLNDDKENNNKKDEETTFTRCRSFLSRVPQAPQHLQCIVPVSLTEALFGCLITITHLDNTTFQVKTPAYTYLNNDKKLLVRGKGMPIKNHSHEYGDLFIVITVEEPTTHYLRTLTDSTINNLKDNNTSQIKIHPPRT